MKKGSIAVKWWKNILTNSLWCLKNNCEDFENSTKCWICDSDCADDDVKIRDHYHITGKYRGSAHRDCTINVKLNYKFLSYSQPKKLWFTMQELTKFNLNKLS